MIKNKFLKLLTVLCCACLALGCAVLGVNALPHEAANAEETRTAVATYTGTEIAPEGSTVVGNLYTNANDSTKYDLAISGTGSMTDWTTKTVPWYSYRSDIVSVTIEEGVTTIGNYAFNQCSSLTAIEIPSTVTDIREQAFYGTGLTEVTVPEAVKYVRASAFGGSSSLYLKKIVFLGSPSITKSALHASTVIYGYKGSSAETYATENSRTFVALDAIFTQVSVTLGSDLTVNYYAAITAEQATTATVNFTVNSYAQTGVTGTLYSEGVYLFRFTGVAPQWIADTITATLSVSGEELETKTYSVQTYCNSLLASTAAELGLSDAKYAAMKVLVADLLSYGSAAQAYLTANEAENVGTTAITTVEGGSTFTAPKSDLVYSNNLSGVTVAGANLYFDNANALLLYFTIDESVSLDSLNVFITKNGAPVKVIKGTELLKDENGYYYKTDAIAATGFDDLYTATAYVDDLTVSASVTYSVASYVAGNYGAENELAALVQALWNYGVSAQAYAAA